MPAPAEVSGRLSRLTVNRTFPPGVEAKAIQPLIQVGHQRR